MKRFPSGCLMLWPVLLAFWPLPADSHLIGPATDIEHFNPWLVDPVAVFLLVLTGWVYWRGCRKKNGSAARTDQSRRLFKQRQRCFWAGWSVLAIALASPLDPLGEVLFTAHMIQHELMMLIAAPLLILSRPGGVLLSGLSRPVARGFGGLMGNSAVWQFWTLLVSPPIAWLVHGIGLWGWHVPPLFEAGLHNTWIHALQHFSFLWVALIFWYALLRPARVASIAGVLYLFTTAIHASILGALLTFSSKVWYTPYLDTAPRWGLSALEDQQLGGLIMWIPAGLVFIAAGLWILARAIGEDDADLAGGNRPASGGLRTISVSGAKRPGQ